MVDKKRDSVDLSINKRDALKVLAVGGVAASAQWTKPVVHSAVVPAHATTTGAATLLGGVGDFNSGLGSNSNPLENLLDVLPDPIQNAHAASPFDNCSSQYFGRYSHCVTVEVASRSPGTNGTLTLEGGTDSYAQCQSATFTLGGTNGREIPPTAIGCYNLDGTMNEDFGGASGEVREGGGGSGATFLGSWAVTEGGSCTPESGEIPS